MKNMIIIDQIDNIEMIEINPYREQKKNIGIHLSLLLIYLIVSFFLTFYILLIFI